MRVRVGTELLGATVPAHYQAAAFPAFAALVALLLSDRGARPPPWLGRSVILGVSSAVAVSRLLGAHPLSGHAVFLTAALAHEAAGRPRSSALLGSAVLGLGVTAVYKVAWGDVSWGAISIGAGAALGILSRLMGDERGS